MWICPECGREFKRKNQNHTCGIAPKTITEYISKQNLELQPKLTKLYKTISDAIPKANETIAWGMPTWKKRKNIIHFALQKNHIGLHVGEEAIFAFSKKLQTVDYKKGVIHLKLDEELPLELISDMAKWLYIKDQNK